VGAWRATAGKAQFLDLRGQEFSKADSLGTGLTSTAARRDAEWNCKELASEILPLPAQASRYHQ
jgi:hypothetical protein